MQSSSFRAGITTERSDKCDIDPVVTESRVSFLSANHDAVAPGAGLPGQFASKDWTLVEEPSVLHSDVSEDVTTKGYCYFQLVKG